MFAELAAAAERHGWTMTHLEVNVWRYERPGCRLEVAFTFGGGHGIQTAHVVTPTNDWRVQFKDTKKRMQVLAVLEGHWLTRK